FPFWNRGYTNKDKTRVRYKCNTAKCPATVYATVTIIGSEEDHALDLNLAKLPSHNHAPPESDSYWQRRFYALLLSKFQAHMMLSAKNIYNYALADVPMEVKHSIPCFERYRVIK
ncbi:hypothetical protein FOZ63_009173, partial [Perkinsus olseni]